MDSRAMAPMEGSASPRKPKVVILKRSSSPSLEVACRSTASVRSAAPMPSPSSLTRMRESPPATVTTSIARAPASSAFSTSSLTTLAGRSITSPAAMRLIVSGLSWRTGNWCLPGQSHKETTIRPAWCKRISRSEPSTSAEPVPRRAWSGKDAPRQLAESSHALARDHLGQLHGRLIEGIDAHQPGSENRFQQEMHHQRPNALLVKASEVEDTHRTAGTLEGFGHGCCLRSHEVTCRPAGQVAKACRASKGRRYARSEPSGWDAHHAHKVFARSVHEELQQAVLVDRAQCGDGGSALAALAQALRPQLRKPVSEPAEPVGIGHHDLGAHAPLTGHADRDGGAQRWRKLARRLGGHQC